MRAHKYKIGHKSTQYFRHEQILVKKNADCKLEFAILQAEIKITGYIHSIYKVG